MIVFWREPWKDEWGARQYGWRCYKGAAKRRNGYLDIRPINGKRKRLNAFIAFDDDKSQPSKLVSAFQGMAGDVDLLVTNETAKPHLPPMYIDNHGNVRRTDEKLTLVLMGPNWGVLQEEEFQEVIAVPF